MPSIDALSPGFIDPKSTVAAAPNFFSHTTTPEAMRASARVHRRYGTQAFAYFDQLIPLRRRRPADCLPPNYWPAPYVVLVFIVEGPFISRSRPGFIAMLYSGRDKGRSGLARGSIRSRIVHGDSGTRRRSCGILKTLPASGIRVSVGQARPAPDTLIRAYRTKGSWSSTPLQCNARHARQGTCIVCVALTDETSHSGALFSTV